MKNITIILIAILFQLQLLAQVNFTSSKLPIVIIKTFGNIIVDDPKVIAHIGIINNASGLNLLSDVPNDVSSYIGIDYRGSSSQWFPKKGYGIELRDSTNTSVDIKKSVLGMPAESDWILYAPYTDKTFFRDVLTHSLFNQMGEYSPKCKFVELVIDSVYQGVYVMVEKIKRDNNRVNVSKMLATDVSGVNITGGYILKIDKTTGIFNGGFSSNINTYLGNPKNIYFQYDYPKTPNPQQQVYIKSYIDSFEQAMLAPDWQNPITGYRKFINVNSFMDFFFLNELGHNVDGYRLSTYLHKKRSTSGDGKLHMGPIWDFNLAYGNADYCDGWRTDTWAIDQPCDGNAYPFWWDRFFKDSTYTQDLRCKYNDYRTNILSTTNIFANIDSMVAYIDTGATNRNYAQWPILGNYVWPNYYVGNTYAQEIDSFKSFISQRLVWMDANMPGFCPSPLAAQDIQNFSAKQNNKNVNLNWLNNESENLDFVEIEKSKDALIFKPLLTVNPYTTSTIDQEPFLGKNYYRLKQVSTSGQIKYSNIVHVYFSHNHVFKLYPTTSNGTIDISTIAHSKFIIDIEIYNRLGQLMQKQPETIYNGNNKFTINVSNLPNGSYYTVCKQNNQIICSMPFFMQQ